ncbi:hypothetical protein RB195_024769 [Necator americanus]|uniref:TAZ zinc finger n=1 Tax=Necator americanus TaxID=51031 RepID=A0ABR1EPJ0_NECAM
MEDFLDEVDTTPAFALISAAIRAFAHRFEGSQDNVLRQLDVIESACLELLKRSEPRSPCAFCTLEQNSDMHHSARCSRFPDAVARPLQAARLALFERCLKEKHGKDDCGVNCVHCGLPHNTFLCSSRDRPSVPHKRRQN